MDKYSDILLYLTAFEGAVDFTEYLLERFSKTVKSIVCTGEYSRKDLKTKNWKWAIIHVFIMETAPCETDALKPPLI